MQHRFVQKQNNTFLHFAAEIRNWNFFAAIHHKNVTAYSLWNFADTLLHLHRNLFDILLNLSTIICIFGNFRTQILNVCPADLKWFHWCVCSLSFSVDLVFFGNFFFYRNVFQFPNLNNCIHGDQSE